MSQEPVLFNFSIEENIAYGCNAKVSLSDIQTVAVSFSHLFFILSFFSCLFKILSPMIDVAENG